MFDIIAVGEYLIDFTPAGRGSMGNPAYEMNPGGAPCNCVAACVSLGGSGAVLSAVGDDLFGRFLIEKLRESGIDGSGIQVIPDVHTTLALVSLLENGEREFAFLRDPGADTQLNVAHINFSLLDACCDLHFGSLSLCQDPALSATMQAVRYAKEHGVQISFDPNYRAPLWRDTDTAVAAMMGGLRFADVVKLSEEEMELILCVKKDDPAAGVAKLFELGVSTCYITYGAEGAYYADYSTQGFMPGFPVEVADTTGCGDAFMGAALYLQLKQPSLPIKQRARMANAVGALCATKKGGMMAMPGMRDVQAFVEAYDSM